MEYLYSDEGQTGWLKGYCNPIRYDDMVAKAPAHPGRPEPSCRTSTGAVLPTLDPDHAAAKDLITKRWPTGRRCDVK